MSIYRSDPNSAPDSEFEPGVLEHLVPGNTGRMLDPRRTPVSLLALHPDRGIMDLRIEGFEDEGAVWEIPFEKIGHYQFARGAQRASAETVAAARTAVERLDRPLYIPRDELAVEETFRRLDVCREEAGSWLEAHSGFFRENGALPDPTTRRGDPRLAADLTAYLGTHDLAVMETAFAERFVSNPYAGELVKGHRMLFAELGLVAFEDKLVRDPDLFSGDWTRARRRDHILRRMGFVQAMFARLGLSSVTLYRGFSTSGPVRTPANRTFVSTTFSEEVARSHFDSDAEGSGAFYRHTVPVERLFMTYHETAAMNGVFLEAEAVLLFDPGASPF